MRSSPAVVWALSLTGLTTAQTIRLGTDFSNYFPTGTQAPSVSPAPSGTNLLFTDGNQNGDVYAYLSPDLQSKVSDATKSSCGDKSSGGQAKCQEAINNALQNPDVDLQARQFGEIIGPLLALEVAGVIQEGIQLHNQPVPTLVHLDVGMYNQVTSTLSAYPTTAVVVGESGSPITITEGPVLTTATGTAPSISTVTASMSTHNKGDVDVILNKDLASRAQEILARTDICPGSSKKNKRGLNLDCVLDSSKMLTLNAQTGYALHDLALVKGSFPPFSDSATANMENEAARYAQSLESNLGLDSNGAANLGRMNFALSYQYHTGGPLNVDNYFPAGELSAGTPASITACPTTPIICQDDECKAPTFTIRTCLQTPNEGCSCTNEASRDDGQYYNTASGNVQGAILSELVAATASVTLPPPAFPTSYICRSSTGYGTCSCYPLTSGGYFPRDAAIQAIDQTCGSWDGKTIDSSVGDGSISDYQPMSNQLTINADGGSWVIYIGVGALILPNVDPKNNKIDKNSCTNALTSLIDGCQTDTTSQKIGGQYKIQVQNIGEQAFVLYPGDGNPYPGSSSASSVPPSTTSVPSGALQTQTQLSIPPTSK